MIKKTIKLTASGLVTSLKAVVLASLVAFISLSSGEMKKLLDKKLTEDYLYKVIYSKKSEGKRYEAVGATAFLVEAPSGKTYILTNRHVCEKEKSTIAKIMGTDEAVKDLKIIELSKIYDLCLAEAPPGKKGIKIADSITVGETIFYTGFPRGQDMTLIYGDIIGHTQMTVTRGIVGEDFSRELCSKNKDTSLVKEDFFGKVIEVCYMHHRAMVSTMFIYGGASGSPVLNKFHQLVGVVYAAPVQGGWGWAMPLSAVKDFLKGR